MTDEQKIEKLIGATVAVIDATTNEFCFFTEADAALAQSLVTNSEIEIGVCPMDARLYFHSPECDTIWKFADRNLASLAK